ncbi:MAG: DUF1638 domain-containing protein [Ruminococcaceae bacterium]|jgi:hypothetical protein|nr:DUF1638 domain-containing protein [Oscillospiraceae bacterium]
MKTSIIACKTISDELDWAMRETCCDAPVIWLEQGLHNVPAELRRAVQAGLDEIGEGRVLLAMGFCGNAIHGLTVPVDELIVPRVDDCISLLLGSVQRRLAVSRELSAYFFTEGWLRGERNIWVEHQHMLEQYGEELTEELEKSMFGHYKTLGLLDCGIAPIEPLIAGTKMIAEGLHLEQKVIPASARYLAELLTGPWPDARFLVLKKGQRIDDELLSLPEE